MNEVGPLPEMGGFISFCSRKPDDIRIQVATFFVCYNTLLLGVISCFVLYSINIYVCIFYNSNFYDWSLFVHSVPYTVHVHTLSDIL